MDVDELVAHYLRAWNARDPESRADALERSWAVEGVYVDPTARVEGLSAMTEHLAGFGERFPGTHFELGSRVDGYGGHARFLWRLVSDADGSDVLAGMDVVELDADGRIRSLTGFFGPL